MKPMEIPTVKSLEQYMDDAAPDSIFGLMRAMKKNVELVQDKKPKPADLDYATWIYLHLK